MADCIDLNCPAFSPHTLSDCGDVQIGGYDAALVIKCGQTLADPSDDVEVNALISGGNALKITNVKAGIDAASPIEIDPVVACGPSKVINYDRQGNLLDANVNAGNVTMYNDIFSGRSFGGLLLRGCDGTVTYINSEISIQGSRIVPNNNNEAQRFEGVFKWKSQTEPTIHTEPAGVF